MLSAASYWDTTYQHCRFVLIVSKHMENLVNNDPVTSDQNLKGLRKLYNGSVELNTRSLKALGVKPETYGTMLASVLLGKLPTDLRLIIGCQTAGSELTLRSVQEVMEEELTARGHLSTSYGGMGSKDNWYWIPDARH